MKILVVKFGVNAIEAAVGLSDSIVAVCDPDVNGRILAQHEFPKAKVYADTSLAIRESGCDTVLLTISDHAPQLALLAMAYGKSVLKTTNVDYGEYVDKVFALAFATGTRMEYL